MILPISKLKKFSDLWCGARKRPGACITISVGHLRVAIFYNLLNNSYEPIS